MKLSFLAISLMFSVSAFAKPVSHFNCVQKLSHGGEDITVHYGVILSDAGDQAAVQLSYVARGKTAKEPLRVMSSKIRSFSNANCSGLAYRIFDKKGALLMTSCDGKKGIARIYSTDGVRPPKADNLLQCKLN